MAAPHLQELIDLGPHSSMHPKEKQSITFVSVIFPPHSGFTQFVTVFFFFLSQVWASGLSLQTQQTPLARTSPLLSEEGGGSPFGSATCWAPAQRAVAQPCCSSGFMPTPGLPDCSWLPYSDASELCHTQVPHSFYDPRDPEATFSHLEFCHLCHLSTFRAGTSLTQYDFC